MTSTGEFNNTIFYNNICKATYYQAVVLNDCGINKGSIIDVTIGQPEVSTGNVYKLNSTLIKLSGNLYHLGGSSWCEVWFEYGKSEGNLDKESSHMYLTSADEFDFCPKDIIENTIYYYRAVSHNHECIDYGEIKSFNLLDFNEGPSPPTILDGATNGIINHYYKYSAIAEDPQNDRLQYYFDWDDGKEGDWTDFYNSGEIGRADHSWIRPGVYYVRVIAKDVHGISSNWSQAQCVKILDTPNNPPNKPIITSATKEGRINTNYTFSTYAVDPDGDMIAYYLWDWGDGEDKRTITLGPFESGVTIHESHKWDEPFNTYEIKVWAIDIYQGMSNSSDPLNFLISKLKLCNFKYYKTNILPNNIFFFFLFNNIRGNRYG